MDILQRPLCSENMGRIRKNRGVGLHVMLFATDHHNPILVTHDGTPLMNVYSNASLYVKRLFHRGRPVPLTQDGATVAPVPGCGRYMCDAPSWTCCKDRSAAKTWVESERIEELGFMSCCLRQTITTPYSSPMTVPHS